MLHEVNKKKILSLVIFFIIFRRKILPDIPLWSIQLRPRTEKKNTKTEVIRHHGGPIDGPPEARSISQHTMMASRGLKGALNKVPIIPRHAWLI